MAGPFKMAGFSGFGNSPVKNDENKIAKSQSEHAAKVKKATGRDFSSRYVSGDYSGPEGEAARKLDVEIDDEYYYEHGEGKTLKNN